MMTGPLSFFVSGTVLLLGFRIGVGTWAACDAHVKRKSFVSYGRLFNDEPSWSET